jgi:uncharacterized protein YceH (UPF0502 family)
MPRERMYTSNADRQAAYRARLAERQALAESGQLTGRLAELEAALAAANRRADRAEQKAATAERQAAIARDRYADLLASRPNRLAGAPRWAKDRVEGQLAAALDHIAELEATVAELRARLPASSTSTGTSATPGLNRAARRAAERDHRRRH